MQKFDLHKQMCYNLFIIILIFTISTIIYKKSLEKKINDKLKRI